MLHPYQILLPLLSLFLCRVDLTDLFALSLQVKIEKVMDGDTIAVIKGSYHFRIRLSRVDAPEKAQSFYGGGSAGTFAKECLLKSLSKSQWHTMRMERFDLYGRILGDIDGVNQRLIHNGCMSIYPHTQFSSRREKAMLLRELSLARHERRGIWKESGYLQPKIWRKLNKRNAHPPSRQSGRSRRPYRLARKSG
jgi:endonuclease YncB( thermonuclease family)